MLASRQWALLRFSQRAACSTAAASRLPDHDAPGSRPWERKTPWDPGAAALDKAKWAVRLADGHATLDPPMRLHFDEEALEKRRDAAFEATLQGTKSSQVTLRGQVRGLVREGEGAGAASPAGSAPGVRFGPIHRPQRPHLPQQIACGHFLRQPPLPTLLPIPEWESLGAIADQEDRLSYLLSVGKKEAEERASIERNRVAPARIAKFREDLDEEEATRGIAYKLPLLFLLPRPAGEGKES